MTEIAADLPDYVPADLELRLQDRSTFEAMHRLGETGNYLYMVGHKAIALAATPSLDNDHLERAVSVGIEAYEILVSTMMSPGTYSEQDEMQAVLVSARQFLDDLARPEDFQAKVDYARAKLLSDAPRLAESVEEITSRYVDYDRVATQFALGGAAVMRGLQIHIDRTLAA